MRRDSSRDRVRRLRRGRLGLDHELRVGPHRGRIGRAESTNGIDIADFKYMPAVVTVSAGTKVTWTNSDDAAHTATADDDSFDTGDLDRGDSKSIVLDEPGLTPTSAVSTRS